MRLLGTTSHLVHLKQLILQLDKIERERKLKLARRAILLLSLLQLERNTMLIRLDDLVEAAIE